MCRVVPHHWEVFSVFCHLRCLITKCSFSSPPSIRLSPPLPPSFLPSGLSSFPVSNEGISMTPTELKSIKTLLAFGAGQVIVQLSCAWKDVHQPWSLLHKDKSTTVCFVANKNLSTNFLIKNHCLFIWLIFINQEAKRRKSLYESFYNFLLKSWESNGMELTWWDVERHPISLACFNPIQLEKLNAHFSRCFSTSTGHR